MLPNGQKKSSGRLCSAGDMSCLSVCLSPFVLLLYFLIMPRPMEGTVRGFVVTVGLLGLVVSPSAHHCKGYHSICVTSRHHTQQSGI